MHSRKAQLAAFNRLLDIMDDLREKCPWDKKQTLESLRHLTIEETYELGDAILTFLLWLNVLNSQVFKTFNHRRNV